MTGDHQPTQRLLAHRSAHDGPVEQAARWDNSCEVWMAILGLCVLTMIVSVWLIWGDSGSTVGSMFRNKSIRTNPGHMAGGYAIVDEDGGYQFVPWPGGPEDFDLDREAACEVSVFLSYRPRERGWYGLTTSHRPLNFHLRMWRDGEAAELDPEVRKRFQLEMLDHVCEEDYPNADCPYREILAAGKVRSNERTGRVYSDSYSLRRIRWSGYAHNLVTIVSILLTPIAFRRMRLARRQYHLWKAVVARSICPVCEYDMRMLPEPRCPECGTEFRPTVP